MKIPLRINETSKQSPKAAKLKVIEKDIIAIKKGDWNAKRELLKEFRPLLETIAQRRSNTDSEIEVLIQAGEKGLIKAAKKFRISSGIEHFQIYALKHIEKAMDHPRGNLLSRLFGLIK